MGNSNGFILLEEEFVTNMNIFKVNEKIRVHFEAIGAQTGIVDLQMTVITPDGSTPSGFPVTMSELLNGLYYSEFTPTETGQWWIKITSVSYPEHGFAKSYVVSSYGSYEGIPTILTDADGDVADITVAGRLKVSQEPPVAPEDTTSIKKEDYGNVSNKDDLTWIIPNGETLILQRLSGGGEQGNAGSVIELWYDPNGNGVGMTIIDAIHVNGTSDQHDLNDTFLGDGTKSIRMRRKRYSGGAKELFGRWEGYY